MHINNYVSLRLYCLMYYLLSCIQVKAVEHRSIDGVELEVIFWLNATSRTTYFDILIVNTKILVFDNMFYKWPFGDHFCKL